MKPGRIVGLSVAVLVYGLSSTPIGAQEGLSRTVEQYTCKDVMRESGADREVAIAFLHGFILGKSGSSTFKIDVLRKQTLTFIEHCLDSPSDRALDVMSKIKD
jgi:hypothetical protein